MDNNNVNNSVNSNLSSNSSSTSLFVSTITSTSTSTSTFTSLPISTPGLTIESDRFDRFKGPSVIKEVLFSSSDSDSSDSDSNVVDDKISSVKVVSRAELVGKFLDEFSEVDFDTQIKVYKIFLGKRDVVLDEDRITFAFLQKLVGMTRLEQVKLLLDFEVQLKIMESSSKGKAKASLSSEKVNMFTTPTPTPTPTPTITTSPASVNNNNNNVIKEDFLTMSRGSNFKLIPIYQMAVTKEMRLALKSNETVVRYSDNFLKSSLQQLLGPRVVSIKNLSSESELISSFNFYQSTNSLYHYRNEFSELGCNIELKPFIAFDVDYIKGSGSASILSDYMSFVRNCNRTFSFLSDFGKTDQMFFIQENFRRCFVVESDGSLYDSLTGKVVVVAGQPLYWPFRPLNTNMVHLSVVNQLNSIGDISVKDGSLIELKNGDFISLAESKVLLDKFKVDLSKYYIEVELLHLKTKKLDDALAFVDDIDNTFFLQKYQELLKDDSYLSIYKPFNLRESELRLYDLVEKRLLKDLKLSLDNGLYYMHPYLINVKRCLFPFLAETDLERNLFRVWSSKNKLMLGTKYGVFYEPAHTRVDSLGNLVNYPEVYFYNIYNETLDSWECLPINFTQFCGMYYKPPMLSRTVILNEGMESSFAVKKYFTIYDGDSKLIYGNNKGNFYSSLKPVYKLDNLLEILIPCRSGVEFRDVFNKNIKGVGIEISMLNKYLYHVLGISEVSSNNLMSKRFYEINYAPGTTNSRGIVSSLMRVINPRYYSKFEKDLRVQGERVRDLQFRMFDENYMRLFNHFDAYSKGLTNKLPVVRLNTGSSSNFSTVAVYNKAFDFEIVSDNTFGQSKNFYVDFVLTQPINDYKRYFSNDSVKNKDFIHLLYNSNINFVYLTSLLRSNRLEYMRLEVAELKLLCDQQEHKAVDIGQLNTISGNKAMYLQNILNLQNNLNLIDFTHIQTGINLYGTQLNAEFSQLNYYLDCFNQFLDFKGTLNYGDFLKFKGSIDAYLSCGGLSSNDELFKAFCAANDTKQQYDLLMAENKVTLNFLSKDPSLFSQVTNESAIAIIQSFENLKMVDSPDAGHVYLYLYYRSLALYARDQIEARSSSIKLSLDKHLEFQKAYANYETLILSIDVVLKDLEKNKMDSMSFLENKDSVFSIMENLRTSINNVESVIDVCLVDLHDAAIVQEAKSFCGDFYSTEFTFKHAPRSNAYFDDGYRKGTPFIDGEDGIFLNAEIPAGNSEHMSVNLQGLVDLQSEFITKQAQEIFTLKSQKDVLLRENISLKEQYFIQSQQKLDAVMKYAGGYLRTLLRFDYLSNKHMANPIVAKAFAAETQVVVNSAQRYHNVVKGVDAQYKAELLVRENQEFEASLQGISGLGQISLKVIRAVKYGLRVIFMGYWSPFKVLEREAVSYYLENQFYFGHFAYTTGRFALVLSGLGLFFYGIFKGPVFFWGLLVKYFFRGLDMVQWYVSFTKSSNLLFVFFTPVDLIPKFQNLPELSLLLGNIFKVDGDSYINSVLKSDNGFLLVCLPALYSSYLLFFKGEGCFRRLSNIDFGVLYLNFSFNFIINRLTGLFLIFLQLKYIFNVPILLTISESLFILQEQGFGLYECLFTLFLLNYMFFIVLRILRLDFLSVFYRIFNKHFKSKKDLNKVNYGKMGGYLKINKIFFTRKKYQALTFSEYKISKAYFDKSWGRVYGCSLYHVSYNRALSLISEFDFNRIE